jgi:hypothetical protein
MSEKKRESPAGLPAGETPGATGEEAAAAGTQEGGESGAVAFPYAAAGATFTRWLNDRLRQLPDRTVKLGAKTATVIELHPDGRLEVSPHAAAGEAEQAFVSLDAPLLDRLILKLAAQGG